MNNPLKSNVMEEVQNSKCLALQLVDILLQTCENIEVLQRLRQVLETESKSPSNTIPKDILGDASKQILIKILKLRGCSPLIELILVDVGIFEKSLLMLGKSLDNLYFAKSSLADILEKQLIFIEEQREQLGNMKNLLDPKLYKECLSKLNQMENSCKLAKNRYE